MTTSAVDLLRRLGAGSLLAGSGAPDRPSTPIHGLNFKALLGRAESGDLASGRVVTVAPSAGLTLSDSQIGRLSKAADAAEAAGARRVLTVIDGQALVLDVPTRTIEARVDGSKGLAAGSVLTGIDGAITVPPDGAPAPGADGAALFGSSAPPPLGPARRIANRSLAELLGRAGG